MTTYIVLRTLPKGNCYEHVGTADANGPQQAIKIVREGDEAFGIMPEPGREEFHAIPSWNWTTLAVVTEVPAPRTLFKTTVNPADGGPADDEAVARRRAAAAAELGFPEDDAA